MHVLDNLLLLNAFLAGEDFHFILKCDLWGILAIGSHDKR